MGLLFCFFSVFAGKESMTASAASGRRATMILQKVAGISANAAMQRTNRREVLVPTLQSGHNICKMARCKKSSDGMYGTAGIYSAGRILQMGGSNNHRSARAWQAGRSFSAARGRISAFDEGDSLARPEPGDLDGNGERRQQSSQSEDLIVPKEAGNQGQVVELYCSGLPYAWGHQDLRTLFEPLGTVVSARVLPFSSRPTTTAEDGLSVILPLFSTSHSLTR
jgi:hypothetical protein